MLKKAWKEEKVEMGQRENQQQNNKLIPKYIVNYI